MCFFIFFNGIPWESNIFQHIIWYNWKPIIHSDPFIASFKLIARIDSLPNAGCQHSGSAPGSCKVGGLQPTSSRQKLQSPIVFNKSIIMVKI